MAVSAARLAADSLRVLPRKRISRVLGRVADLGGPAPLVRQAVRTFVRVYGVDLAEAVIPDGGFASFQDFFTRRLREGARPVDPDPNVLVSPADGRIEAAGPIDPDAVLMVKGRPYTVRDLLADDADAARFRGGTFFIVYLSPRDYHRVHSPVTGRVRHARHVPGTLYPVNAIGLEHIPKLFARNERVATFLETERFGEVAVVLVGAMGVGRIGVSFDSLETNRGRAGGVRRYGDAAPSLTRGEELGVFHLGSTVIVFVDPDHPLHLRKAAGDRVRVGEAVAHRDGA